MELHKEDVPTLDFLLDLLIKRDSHIFGDDLKSLEKYKDSKSDFLRSEFKRLRYYFGHFGCGDPKDDGGLAEWISPSLASTQFQHSGGFKNAYENSVKDSKDKQLEKDLKRLQKENLEYSQTIREQDNRIRDLNEELKLMGLIKQYWWFIGACIGLGYMVREFLDKT